ncbi:TPA: hypothetical protein ACGVAR_002838 [Vibrio vulnificus]
MSNDKINETMSSRIDIDFDLRDFHLALSNYRSITASQYSEITHDSAFIYFNGVVDTLLTDLSLKLQQTNYEISALEQETVVLFIKPLLLSTVHCGNLGNSDSKSKVIRLITGKTTSKKVALANGDNNTSSFTVNEIVWGFIIPTSSVFLQATALDFEKLLHDGQTISSISKAHNRLSDSITILVNKFNSSKEALRNVLVEQETIYNLMLQDTETLVKEKERLEKSISNESAILDRVRTDISESNEALERTLEEKESTLAKVRELKSLVNKQEHNIQSNVIELEGIQTETNQSKEDLRLVKEQLAKVKADINVTTLDMQGFSLESSNQVKKYYFLALTILFFLGGVFCLIYTNANQLIGDVNRDPSISALNILLSRLPLITATTLIIGTLSAFLFYLIKNIISVNDNKMNMLKASILAEQITSSMPKNGMSENEIRDFQRNTKIELVMGVFNTDRKYVPNENSVESIQILAELLKSSKGK